MNVGRNNILLDIFYEGGLEINIYTLIVRGG